MEALLLIALAVGGVYFWQKSHASGSKELSTSSDDKRFMDAVDAAAADPELAKLNPKPGEMKNDAVKAYNSGDGLQVRQLMLEARLIGRAASPMPADSKAKIIAVSDAAIPKLVALTGATPAIQAVVDWFDHKWDGNVASEMPTDIKVKIASISPAAKNAAFAVAEDDAKATWSGEGGNPRTAAMLFTSGASPKAIGEVLVEIEDGAGDAIVDAPDKGKAALFTVKVLDGSTPEAKSYIGKYVFLFAPPSLFDISASV